MVKKNWIAKAVGKNKGALHKNLGVPEGENIPEKKLNKATKGTGKIAKEAKLAKTLKGFKKK